jgi:PAS domain S-box-containing protein
MWCARLPIGPKVPEIPCASPNAFGQGRRWRSGAWVPPRASLILFLACFLFQVRADAQVKGTRRVLYLSDLGTPASAGFTEIETAVFNGLQKSPYKLEFYEEALEVTLFPDEVSQRRFGEEFIRKYSDRKPDVIVAAGSASLKFIAESHESFIRDTPIIFCAVLGEVPDRLNSDIHFTGVLGKLHPAETLSAALRLFPGTKHVVVVGGMGKFDEEWERAAKRAFQNYESKLEFTYLTDLTMPVLLERLRQLPSNTIVYHTAFTQDVTGERFIDSAQAVPLVAGAANAPIFVMDNVDLRAGAVGGDLVNWANDGHVAADMAVRVLNGEKPEDIPVVMSNHAYVFDWRALKRWGLKVSDLPPGSIVLNRQPSIWEIYKRYIMPGVLLLIAQALVIFALLWQRSRRRKVERDLVRTNDRLRLAMESGKSVGWEFELASGHNRWFGDLQTMFGIPSNMFTAGTGDFYHSVHPEDRDRISKAVAKARQDREPYNEEFRVIWSDGTARWVTARGEFEYAPNGEARMMRGMAVDITERKQVDDALKKSEEKFSKAFRESPLALSLTSTKDHRYIEVNETFERITGWSRAEIVGRSALDVGIWVPSQRIEFIKRLLADGNLRNVEFSLHAKDGQVRTGLGSAELIEINGEQCALSVIADITEVKQAEDARRVSEHRFSQFFSTLPEYCYMTSPTGEILDVNPAVCRALGYTKEELLGRPLSDLYAPESALKLVNLLEKWKRTFKLRNEEMVVLTKEGRKRTVLLNAGAVKDTQGNIIYVASVQADITERKEILQRLRESQDRLKGMVESAMDAIIAVDEEQRIIVFNAAAEEMFACRARDAVGASIDRFIPARFRESQLARIRHFGETGATTRTMGAMGAMWGLRNAGEEFPIEASISQTASGGQKLFTLIIRDETERKRAEVALRESEERFRLVANAAPVMIWMSGPEKLCTYFNQPWLEFTGRSIQAALGNGWAESVHPEDLDACLKTYTNAFDRREGFEMEYRLRRHDGEYRWILDQGIPQFQQGSFTGYIGSCIDVTDHKLAEESLADMSRKLIEAQEQERTWIARELHDDITQRITLVLVNLERLQGDSSPLAPAVTQRLTEIKEHLSSLASDVQALSHHLHSSKLEYLGLVTAAGSFCRELSEEHGVEIAFHSESMPKQLPREIALCFFRVLQESLQNALKHSGSKHFEVWLKGSPNEIELTVHDSGTGFDLEEAIRGRGLGLTSMKERLKLVRGRLSVESSLGQGTTICATVPFSSGARAAGA